MFAQESVMEIQKEREAFEAWLKSLNENGRTTYFLGQESTVAWEAWQAAKAKSVPEVINVGNELQSWVAVWSFKARHDREDYIVVDANLLAEKIEKLTGANA